jgi:hypothetical protein
MSARSPRILCDGDVYSSLSSPSGLASGLAAQRLHGVQGVHGVAHWTHWTHWTH